VYQRKVQTTLPYTTINVDLADGRILTSGVYVVEMRGADGRLVGARRIIVYQ
jgi:FAD synthase